MASCLWTVVKMFLLTLLILVSAVSLLFLRVTYRNNAVRLSEYDEILQSCTEEADLEITEIVHYPVESLGGTIVGQYRDADGVLHENVTLRWGKGHDEDIGKTLHVQVDPENAQALLLSDRDYFVFLKNITFAGYVFAAVLLAVTSLYTTVFTVKWIRKRIKEKKEDEMEYHESD